MDHWETKKDFFRSFERREKSIEHMKEMDWTGWNQVPIVKQPSLQLPVKNEEGLILLEPQSKELATLKHPFIERGFHFLSIYPIMNAETIYQVIMRPCCNLYISRLIAKRPNLYKDN